jgi:hypothetical protein
MPVRPEVDAVEGTGPRCCDMHYRRAIGGSNP